MLPRPAHSVPAPDPTLRACRTARRLLSGSGSATLTAFRLAPGAPAVLVTHAMTDSGDLLVAACPPADTPLGMVGPDQAVDVRLDVRLEAAEPGIRVTAATAHLLGTLTWVDHGHRDLVLALAGGGACHCEVTGGDPLDRLAAVAGAPGGRLGLLASDRVVVHDLSGVSGHAMEDVISLGATQAAPSTGGAHGPGSHGMAAPRDGTQDTDGLDVTVGGAEDPGGGASLPHATPPVLWGPDQLFAAHEAVRGLGELALRSLCDGVREGLLAGQVCSVRPATGVCASLWGRVLVVDVTPEGVTLMHVAGTGTSTIELVFAHELATHEQVVAHLGELTTSLAPARPTRI